MQTKGYFYDKFNKYWSFGNLEREHDKDFDNMICYCANKSRDWIERIYIFPLEEILERTGITIVKYSRGKLYLEGWYEKYRVNNNEEIKKINDIWKIIIKETKNYVNYGEFIK